MIHHWIRERWGLVVALGGASAFAGGEVPVQVIVDMDPGTPGYQSSVTVAPCAESVEAAVYLVDPLGTRPIWAIGYLGGIDRGIVFGHVPGDTNHGVVSAITAQPREPANPDNDGFIEPESVMIESFAGPELQYLEYGAAGPAAISARPASPLFTIDISLDEPAPGDVFGFHVLDLVSISFGGFNAGALSTRDGLNTLDTGGDAVPDGTVTLYGEDIDAAVPVPPAAYLVDFIDGPPPPEGGPATIVVASLVGDFDGDCAVSGSDLGELLLAWGPCRRGDTCAPELSGDGVVDGADLGLLLLHWTG